MEYAETKALLEAQFLMGYDRPIICHEATGEPRSWHWAPRTIRQRLHVPRTALWEARIYALETEGLAVLQIMGDFVCEWDEAAQKFVDRPGWEDESREAHAEWWVFPAGVLRLAELYGRPYVRIEESAAVCEHWHVLHSLRGAPHNENVGASDEENFAQWERDWPEVFRGRWAVDVRGDPVDAAHETRADESL